MEPDYNTLQEFMTHTKTIAYLMIGVALVALPLFWRYISGRDN
jgi:hypothetical protein